MVYSKEYEFEQKGVKIANSYEYGTVTGVENGEVLIQLSETLTRKVSFEDFIELGYEVVINRYLVEIDLN